MEQFKTFNFKKQNLINQLNQLKSIVSRLTVIDSSICEDIQKIETAIKDIEDDILKIALVGAFSDGKTSTAAGWLGQVIDDMKINTDESSDEIRHYEINHLSEKCIILDTPGLFGDKSKKDINQKEVLYGDITKKYISEAHLIFYVVDATNPLKDSHKDTVKWLLCDLNKLSSTIFIINKMDEVADLTDSDDFNEQANIKKENLLNKLKIFIDLTDDMINDINIVCISSNPQNKGLDFWFAHKDIYENRSRINDLKDKTNQILNHTLHDFLIHKTGIEVVNDIVYRKLDSMDEIFEIFEQGQRRISDEVEKIEKEIKDGETEILSYKDIIFQELKNFENDLLGKLRVTSRENIIKFLEDEIGYYTKEEDQDKNGIKLQIAIQDICNKLNERSQNIINNINAKVLNQMEITNHLLDNMSKSIITVSKTSLQGFAKLPINTIKDTIISTRNFIADWTGKVWKFKPWGAVNLAKYFVKVAFILNVLIIIWDRKKDQDEKEKFRQAKDEIASFIKSSFLSIYEILIDNQQFLDQFAPHLADLSKNQTILKNALLEMKNKQEMIKEVEAEFKILKGMIDTDSES